MNISHFVEQRSEASLLNDETRADLVKSMSIYVGAGMDEESAFDKAWADTVAF